mgnify:CR=1 FL=1
MQVANAVLLAQHVNKHITEGWDFVVYFMPRTTVMCKQQLQVEGVYNFISIGEYPVDLIPFDGDVLSMELNGSVLYFRLVQFTASSAHHLSVVFIQSGAFAIVT